MVGIDFGWLNLQIQSQSNELTLFEIIRNIMFNPDQANKTDYKNSVGSELYIEMANKIKVQFENLVKYIIISQ